MAVQERLAGVPEDLIVEAHGSFASQRCIECKSHFDGPTLREHFKQKKIALGILQRPGCRSDEGITGGGCAPGGRLRTAPGPRAQHGVDPPCRAQRAGAIGRGRTEQED